MASMWRKIKYADKETIENNITTLLIPVSWPEVHSRVEECITLKEPKESEHWRQVELPEEVIYYLKVRNQRHFDQAHENLFTIPPLSQNFDWNANVVVSELVLYGDSSTYDLSNLQ
eukprot:5975128-Ditylum_brightwellii.AAC.1